MLAPSWDQCSALAPGAETGVTACRLIRARLRALSHRTPDRSAKTTRRAGVRVTLRFKRHRHHAPAARRVQRREHRCAKFLVDNRGGGGQGVRVGKKGRLLEVAQDGPEALPGLGAFHDLARTWVLES